VCLAFISATTAATSTGTAAGACGALPGFVHHDLSIAKNSWAQDALENVEALYDGFEECFLLGPLIRGSQALDHKIALISLDVIYIEMLGATRGRPPRRPIGFFDRCFNFHRWMVADFHQMLTPIFRMLPSHVIPAGRLSDRKIFLRAAENTDGRARPVLQASKPYHGIRIDFDPMFRDFQLEFQIIVTVKPEGLFKRRSRFRCPTRHENR